MSTLQKVAAIAMTGALAAALALSGLAADGKAGKKGSNITPPEGPKPAKASPAVEGASDLSLAYSLIHYGRRHKSPESLITAAQILGSVAAQDVQGEPKTKKNPKAPTETKERATEPPDNSPQALLAEAKKISSDPHIAALADAAAKALEEQPRGAERGPRRWTERVLAHHTDIYRIVFRAREEAIFVVSGDGDTDLDLYVYDENNNLIDKDDDYTDDCVARWCPRWTGPFRIEIVNRGSVYNRYVAAHN